MTTILTGIAPIHRDLRRFKRHGYEILAIETHDVETGTQETIVWAREEDLGISEHDLPF